jgi:hypothetical protein
VTVCDDVCAKPDPASPKSQAQAVGAGEPVDRSVKKTDCPVTGENGEELKLAVGGAGVETVTLCWIGAPGPLAFEVVRVTVYVPAAANG